MARRCRLLDPAVLALLLAAPARSDGAARPVATFSIVAADPAAGAGAVATQAYANTSWGPRGLELLSRSASPEETLAIPKRTDDDPGRRQVGIVAADGRWVTYTGPGCTAWAGGRSGPNYAVQGNILAGEAVVAGIERAFLDTQGDLAERLYAALLAGDAAGLGRVRPSGASSAREMGDI
jgi:uncharacterized Ntn-hydrolase superfamily protein